MARVKCNHCRKSMTCPHCGAVQKRKRSPFKWLVALLLVFWSIGYFSADRRATAALSSIDLDFKWGRAAGGILMMADFTVQNNSPYDVKDIAIRCDQFAKSGTRIDRKTRTLYEVVGAHSKKRFTRFPMGVIDSQVETSSCSIRDLVVM